MIFQKNPRCLENKYIFTLKHSNTQQQYNNNTQIKHTKNYTYLAWSDHICIRIFQHGNKCTYRKIFDGLIFLAITLYGSEIWGPLSRLEHDSWDKHPIEALHTEFCRRTQKYSRRNVQITLAEHFLLWLNIQKGAITLWTHLNLSPKEIRVCLPQPEGRPSP